MLLGLQWRSVLWIVLLGACVVGISKDAIGQKLTFGVITAWNEWIHNRDIEETRLFLRSAT